MTDELKDPTGDKEPYPPSPVKKDGPERDHNGRDPDAVERPVDRVAVPGPVNL